jgi:hypothetical protein
MENVDEISITIRRDASVAEVLLLDNNPDRVLLYLKWW